MITLLHGENIAASRNTLNQMLDKEKKNGIKDVVYLAGENLSLGELKQASESQSLFGSNRLVIVEKFFSRPNSKEKTELMDYIKKEIFQNNLIFWEKKAVHPSTVRSLPPTSQIRVFKIPAIIFKFLDALKPGNIKQMLEILQTVKKTDQPEMIFYLLCRRISDLIVALDFGNRGFDAMQSWQKQRLLSQAKYFNLQKLLLLHNKLFQTDIDLKTGRNVLPLSSTLDLIVADI